MENVRGIPRVARAAADPGWTVWRDRKILHRRGTPAVTEHLPTTRLALPGYRWRKRCP